MLIFRINLAEFPATTVFGITSLVTTEPAPRTLPAPTLTPFRITQLLPIKTLSSKKKEEHDQIRVINNPVFIEEGDDMNAPPIQLALPSSSTVNIENITGDESNQLADFDQQSLIPISFE